MQESREQAAWLRASPGRSITGVRPLRVLIVAPSLDRLGGQSVQAARLLDHLREEPDLQVAFQPIDPRLPGSLQRLQNVRYVRTMLTSLAYTAALLAAVPVSDVLHVFAASYFSFLLAPTPALLLARLCGKRVVLNYHSGEAEDHLRRWRQTAVPTLRLAHAIAVPSSYLVAVMGRFGLKACAIANIVETEAFRFRDRRPLRPVFLSNRNLEPLYNVGCTLRAFARVQQRYPEARLTLAGDGTQRAALENLACELQLRHARFIGRVEPSRMPELYEAADIFLNSSDIDNMPLSIIEAFSAGLPVVTTDAGGIPAMVTHERTGLMARCGDHKALAGHAIRLLEDEALASMIAGNALQECQKYTWSQLRNAWIDLYRNLG